MLLDKKEIAIRHTNQAIKMFFHKEDPVSILVVVCAANQILHTLVCKKELPVLLGYQGFFTKILIKEEYQKEFNKKRNEAYNFFKHADRDYDKTINFNPDLVWYFLLENIIFIKQLDYDFSKEMGYFIFWLTFSKRNLFVKNQYYDDYIKNFSVESDDFFELYDDFVNNDNVGLEILKNFKKWLF